MIGVTEQIIIVLATIPISALTAWITFKILIRRFDDQHR